MKKFAVEIRYSAIRCYVMEADTPREAEELARMLDIKRFPNDNPSRNKFDVITYRDCQTMAEVD